MTHNKSYFLRTNAHTPKDTSITKHIKEVPETKPIKFCSFFPTFFI